MTPTVMASPTIALPSIESLSARRRAVALDHRRQNILTLKYRTSSSPSLRDTVARQQRQIETIARTDQSRSERPRRRNAVTRHKLQSCASYRLQSADIDSWLKESMPLPPTEDFAPPLPLMGLGIAMFEDDRDDTQTKEHVPEREAQGTPRTLAQTVEQLRLTDYDERDSFNYRASDAARSSYYASSSSSSEVLNWPLVNSRELGGRIRHAYR